MKKERWVKGGKLKNGETFYFTAKGKLAVEKGHCYTIKATPQQKEEIYELVPFLKNSLEYKNRESEMQRYDAGLTANMSKSSMELEAENSRQAEEIEVLKGLLLESADLICEYLCPSVKKTGTEWTHVDLCIRIGKAIRQSAEVKE